MTYAELKDKYLKENNVTTLPSRTQKAVLECTAAASFNPITWWKNNCGHRKLKDIAIRVLSCSPTSAVVERMNSMHKLIQTKTRSALKHDRVIKLLFCYVNMRLVDEVDVELLDMVEEALIDEIEKENAEQQERARLASLGDSTGPSTGEHGNGSGSSAGAGRGSAAAPPAGAGARPPEDDNDLDF